jgi:hypothetical protein
VLIVDVLFLCITPIRWFQIVLTIACDLSLCMKCLVLWRYVAFPLQKKDAEESWNAQNDIENPSGPSEAILNLFGVTTEQNDEENATGPNDAMLTLLHVTQVQNDEENATGPTDAMLTLLRVTPVQNDEENATGPTDAMLTPPSITSEQKSGSEYTPKFGRGLC